MHFSGFALIAFLFILASLVKKYNKTYYSEASLSLYSTNVLYNGHDSETYYYFSNLQSQRLLKTSLRQPQTSSVDLSVSLYKRGQANLKGFVFASMASFLIFKAIKIIYNHLSLSKGINKQVINHSARDSAMSFPPFVSSLSNSSKTNSPREPVSPSSEKLKSNTLSSSPTGEAPFTNTSFKNPIFEDRPQQK